MQEAMLITETGDVPADEPEPSGRSGEHVVVASVDDPRRLMSSSALEWLQRRATEAAVFAGAAGEIRMRFVDDAEMASAHERHCGVPGTTDVITFDLSASADALDVDLLLCVDEAKRQSARRTIPLEQELLLYFVHGMLHCMGHDDRDEMSSRSMHAREDEILAAIGVGATYDRPTTTDGAGSPPER
ncbi:MAG: rRNA maturation RNase YbeY [Planctomycetota bacterium]